MSRIGRMPVTIPSEVTVTMTKNQMKVTGPKGELSRTLNPEMSVTREDNTLIVTRPTDDQKHRSQHGLTRTLIYNMVTGVSRGFEKQLEIVGVGYRAEKAGEKLIIRVGYSHTVEVEPLPGITFAVEGNNRIRVAGIDKEAVGEMAARIHKIRPPDAYKGKGIRYAGERVHLKPGKAGKVVGKK
jgi:large subunit ribosomal protein L6